jgi:hypothetical protein
MSAETKGYRGFSDDFKSYRIDDKTFLINDLPAVTMGKLRKELIAIEEAAPNVKGLERFKLQERSLALTKDILTIGLKDFNFDEMATVYGESDLQGVSGDVIGFLSVRRSEKELSLLTVLSGEKLTNSENTPN